MATNYQRGRSFEYRTRDRLYKDGAVYVMRAAQSKGKVDLLALWPTANPGIGAGCFPPPWLVQCKTGSAKMSKKDKQELVELAAQCGAFPVEAQPGPKGRGVVFTVLQKETA